jgi:2,4-dienoyl-CoA reductase-like NADH-dependent reductase (Old Yellow Enzyme family)
VLRLIREAVASRAGDDYPCTVKVPAEVSLPLMPRTSHDDALRLCELVEEFGYDAVTPVEVSVFPDTTLSRGGVPSSLWTHKGMTERFKKASPSVVKRTTLRAGAWFGGKRAPFRPVWNRELFTAAKQRVSIPVFAVGGIRTAAECEEILDADAADMVGIGRPFYAEPDLARRILAGGDGPGLCRNSNHCVPAQMLGMRGTCYNPDVVKLRRRTPDAPA